VLPKNGDDEHKIYLFLVVPSHLHTRRMIMCPLLLCDRKKGMQYRQHPKQEPCPDGAALASSSSSLTVGAPIRAGSQTTDTIHRKPVQPMRHSVQQRRGLGDASKSMLSTIDWHIMLARSCSEVNAAPPTQEKTRFQEPKSSYRTTTLDAVNVLHIHGPR